MMSERISQLDNRCQEILRIEEDDMVGIVEEVFTSASKSKDS